MRFGTAGAILLVQFAGWTGQQAARGQDVEKTEDAKRNAAAAVGLSIDYSRHVWHSELVRIEQRLGETQRELAGIGEHDWAGEYWASMFSCVRVAPLSGAACVGNGMLQYTYFINHGEVVGVEDGVMTLDLVVEPRDYPRRPNARAIIPQTYITEQMIVVRWGERRLLVPVERMPQFCNDVNAGRRLGAYYYMRVKPGERDAMSSITTPRPGDGSPPVVVPQRWRKNVLSEPIEAVITEVGEVTRPSEAESRYSKGLGDDYREHRVQVSAVLDKPTQLSAGMQMHSLTGDKRCVAEVIEVSDGRARLQFRGFTRRGESFTQPRVGDLLSTRARPIEIEDLGETLWLMGFQGGQLELVLDGEEAAVE